MSQDEVKASFEVYGLLGDKVRFVPGWFGEPLDPPPPEHLAPLRLSGDFCESAIDAPRSYDHVADGGIVIIDDLGGAFSMPLCRRGLLRRPQ